MSNVHYLKTARKIESASTPEAIILLAQSFPDDWMIIDHELTGTDEDEMLVHWLDREWFGGDAPVRTLCGLDVRAAVTLDKAWKPLASEGIPTPPKCLICRLAGSDAVLVNVSGDRP